METVGPVSVVEYANTHKAGITQLEGFREASSSDLSPNMFFSGGEDKQIRLWDLRTNGSVKKFSAPWFGEEMGSLRHCPKSQTLLAANQGGIALFDLRTGGPVKLKADFEAPQVTSSTETEVNSIQVTTDEKTAY